MLSWNNTITVVPDTLVNGTHKLSAYSITVFESDGGEALDLWKALMKTRSREVTGSKPTKAIGAVMDQVSDVPVLVLAESSTDKKAGIGRLKLAFAENDSTPVAQAESARAQAHALAVELNKAKVQGQIDVYAKLLEKASDKAESAKADVAKNDKALAKANSSLAKAKKEVSKIQADNAKLHGEITGLEKKFAVTNNPKDLQKLTKARSKLAKGESSLAKAMKNESKAQDTVNKYQGKAPDRAQAHAEHLGTKQELEAIKAKLERKLEAIR
jgi:chromosome segregation ATPase